MVGVGFGLARYGYGLLLPEMRRSLHLSSAVFGLIATGSYAAYLLGTVLVGAIGNRLGPRPPVILGGAAAVLGMGILARADSAWILALGVLVAGASGALVYAPF